MSLILALVLVIGSVAYVNYSKPRIISRVQSVHYHHTYPVVTKIIRDSVYSSSVDTMTIDGHQYRIATLDTSIDTTKAAVDLKIKYNEYTGLWNLKAKITTFNDSTYTNTQTDNTTSPNSKKAPFISLIGGVNPTAIRNKGAWKLDGLGVDAGLRIADKWDVELTARSDETYGVRIGGRF
jgi:hypothetical protein